MKLLMCNLKTNKTLTEMENYLINASNLNADNLVIFPTNLYLSIINKYEIPFGAQDVSIHTEGNNTGEITAKQIKSTGATYTILGHSERRAKFNEDEYILNKKIKNALDANLKIVYCIGETFEEKERHKTYHVLEKQIAKIFNNLSISDMKKIIIAYEPVWAIGSGNAANPELISEITDFIKKIVLDYYDYKIKVLYGGSVNSNNINEFENVDGFLVGKASLEISEVAKMLQKIS